MSPTAGESERSALLVGERALFVEGDLRTGRKWLDAAYHEAERNHDEQAMARAALGLGGLWVHEHRTAGDAAIVRERQRDALTMLDADSSLALRLRVRLAGEEDYRNGTHAAILAMVTETRRAGDEVALAEALSLAHHCVLGPAHGALRLKLAGDLIAAAARTRRRGDRMMGLMWYTVDLFLGADPHAERRLEELRGALADDDHLAVGFVVGAMEVMLAIRDGRFAEAETLSGNCAERGVAAGDVDAVGWYGAQLGSIRWYQGRIAELVPMLSELVDSPTLSTVDNAYFAALAVAAASAGDRRLAEGMLARLRGRNLAALSHSSSWLTMMYCVVEAAHLLGDTETAAQSYALLSPFARLPMIASLGVTCFGSVHHSLGVASLTSGDVATAIEHLNAAVRANLALGHWPAVVLSRSRLGQALLLRDGPRSEAAHRELALAAQDAAALGMAAPAVAEHGLAAGAGAPAVVCRRRGRQWHVELGSRSVLVEHSVGMRHLASLLANPGYEILATDLAAGAGLLDAAGVAEGVAVESAQPVLDEVAKQKYEARLAQLRDEIEEYGPNGSATDALRVERDWLIAEMSASAGLGGRSREFAGNPERARIAVGKAIRRALSRITEADPVIGAELRATIQTGMRCCYRPG
ncbi:hypothetical protein [Actinomadura sp. DC4]|uniref:hypothetical protein n=1 Tax=Actinomadura sp. DC4 TaxID=3055069 RepID=UPI0025B2537C|nr:hypothetical protein [Actinomadura sp. DC4]MDN3358687.1 hypothetical protein [Actinomadura sp. DC4]